MTTNPKRRAASKSRSIGRISIFGPPPILEGENSATYDELLARVTGHIKPTDVIEEIFIRDVVDLTWENLRWRRLKAGLFDGDLLNKLESPSIFLEKLESIERIDRLITVAEARRNSLLREIDRHRSPLAQTLRGTVQEIETTALEIVKPRIAPKNMINKNAA